MRRQHVLFGIYAGVCLLALVWPGYAWFGNRIEPYVLGLPFSFAWNVGWVALTFVVFAAYDWALNRHTDRSRDSGVS